MIAHWLNAYCSNHKTNPKNSTQSSFMATDRKIVYKNQRKMRINSDSKIKQVKRNINQIKIG